MAMSFVNERGMKLKPTHTVLQMYEKDLKNLFKQIIEKETGLKVAMSVNRSVYVVQDKVFVSLQNAHTRNTPEVLAALEAAGYPVGNSYELAQKLLKKLLDTDEVEIRTDVYRGTESKGFLIELQIPYAHAIAKLS